MAVFVNVNNVVDLAVLLTSYSEDDLIKYDHESRYEIVTELQTLCLRFGVIMPTYLVSSLTKNDVYDKQAELRGITPKSILDYINDDFDSAFSSLDEFRSWLSHQAATPEVVEADQTQQTNTPSRFSTLFGQSAQQDLVNTDADEE